MRRRGCDTRLVAVEDELRTMIDGRAGTWGVYARHLDTGETVAIRADEVMPAQSSVKVCVLLAYTKRIRLGDDERDRRVTLLSEDHEMGSGILRYLAPGLSTFCPVVSLTYPSRSTTASPRRCACTARLVWGACECVDAGLFETDECSWVIAAMAKDLPGLWQQTDDEGPRTLADIGETIHHAWRQ